MMSYWTLESDEDPPPPISEDEAKDSRAKEKKDVEEEEESPLQDNLASDSEGNPIKVNLYGWDDEANQEEQNGVGMVMQVTPRKMTMIL